MLKAVAPTFHYDYIPKTDYLTHATDQLVHLKKKECRSLRNSYFGLYLLLLGWKRDSAEKGCGAELCVVDVAGALDTIVVRIVGGCIEELEIDAELTAETTLIEDIATVTGTGGKGGIKYCGWKVLGPGPGTLEECSGAVCGDTEIGVTAVDVGGTGPLGGGVGRAAIFEA